MIISLPDDIQLVNRRAEIRSLFNVRAGVTSSTPLIAVGLLFAMHYGRNNTDVFIVFMKI